MRVITFFWKFRVRKGAPVDRDRQEGARAGGDERGAEGNRRGDSPRRSSRPGVGVRGDEPKQYGQSRDPRSVLTPPSVVGRGTSANSDAAPSRAEEQAEREKTKPATGGETTAFLFLFAICLRFARYFRSTKDF